MTRSHPMNNYLYKITMKTLKVLLFAAVAVLLITACSDRDKNKNAEAGTVELTGVIQQPGMTTYQYGTHTLTSGDKMYALKSSTVDLNKFNGKSVVVKGKKVDGYPVENGPELIDVTEVKEK